MAVALFALAAEPKVALSVETDNWIGTWSASPQPIWDADFVAPLNKAQPTGF